MAVRVPFCPFITRGALPMRWSVIKMSLPVETDLLVLGVARLSDGPDLQAWDHILEAAGVDRQAIASAFSGAEESSLLLPGRAVAPWLLLVGLDAPADLTPQRLRLIAGAAAGQARRLRVARLAFAPLPATAEILPSPRTMARCCVEGAELALSPVGTLKSQADQTAAAVPAEGTILVPDGRMRGQARQGVHEGQSYAEGCLLARNLANLPANHLTPTRLGEEARRLARRFGLRCRLLGPAALEREGMAALLAVTRGSPQEPRLIVVETPPERGTGGGRRQGRGRRRRASDLVALVGKGVTFDAGGISLKPPQKMDLMKNDMSGAAAVLGATLILRQLDSPARLLVVIPACENLPDGNAYKPGDVIGTAAGKTVEIQNTDAEGRLILADALHFAVRRQPDWLIDAATLTGSCATALGEQFAGLMGTSAELMEILQQAGGETWERVWPLPLVAEHRKAMESDLADLKNLGPRTAGMSHAAAFLAAFLPDSLPWAHLDIAGPVWSESGGPLGPKGATGFGARLLARAVQILLS
jgi:leucyl aminopeptidase